MHECRKSLTLLLIVCMIISCTPPAFAAGATASSVFIDGVIADTAAYLLKALEGAQADSTGSEWILLGLARSGCDVPLRLYEDYCHALEANATERQGELHDKKYTEYSRVILSLTSMGKDPSDVGGYNLLEKLSDYNKVVWQGITGPIFALIALDSKNYEIPLCPGVQTQTTRELLIQEIVRRQLPDGGFSLAGTAADPDISAMALQALATYKQRKDITPVIDKALDCLSKLQNSDGGYSSYGTENLESVVQVLVALTALGIDPKTDSRFVKDGQWLLSNLMTYYVKGGGFKHSVEDSSANVMATEQSFYGLVAYNRLINGQNGLYNMSDAKTPSQGTATVGLPNKNPDVKTSPVVVPGKTFLDILGHTAEAEINALASRQILNGVSSTAFQPDREMTRAEFAAIIVKALGLVPQQTTFFKDMEASIWYNGYVGTAFSYGIVTGKTETQFAPLDLITRQEAATMLARAATLCGFDIAVSEGETRDVLAQFGDYVESATWSRPSLAFCLKQGFFSQKPVLLCPKKLVTRAEVAVMVWRMLTGAALLAD